MQGILMTTQNQLATREERKTQTRRLDHLKEINKAPNLWKGIGHDQKGRFSFRFEPSGDVYNYFPRYQVGATVYIKEAWCPDCHEGQAVCYRLNNENCAKSHWHSPMFLKAIYARYFIKILDVKPQRLQEITEKDIRAEGIENGLTKTGYYYAFGQLWNSINGKTYPWKLNPWIWRYCYKLLDRSNL